MCGIAAIFAYDPDAPGVDEGELIAIRDHMTPRGPDGAGNWFSADRRVGLGHRRLSILDLSESGAQPMQLSERQLVITFNGEIYNFRELRASLEQRGHVFQSTGDTEVLLRLYAEYGEAMVEKLRGMFAFAILDGRRKGLFLARDAFGIKPLYYADDGKTFRAASQVKALLAGGNVDTTPQAAGHVGFFLWGHTPEPYTFFRAIRSLPAGATMWVDADGARPAKSFCRVPQIFAEAEREGSRGGAVATRDVIRAAMQDSVRHHLVSDVPVGIFLSSGLDSTTLAALAAEQGSDLRTVTLGFEEYRGTDNDETPLAEKVAKQYGARHETVWVSRADFAAESDRLFHAMDCPTTDGVNSYFVSLAAARTKLKVALSGLGGDELFGGYPSFTEVPRAAGMLGWLPPGSSFGKLCRVVSAPVLRRFTSPKYAGLLEYGGSYGGAYLLRRAMFMPWELPEILDPDVVRQGWRELQSVLRLDATVAGVRHPQAKVSCLEMCWYMRNQLLRDADWAGMAHSLEIRVPLVDLGLLRSVAPLLDRVVPPGKLDMAAAPRQKLPPEILRRPKTGFQIPVRDWLLGKTLKTESRKRKAGERGLRGWARHVYGRFAGPDLLTPAARWRMPRASTTSYPPATRSRTTGAEQPVSVLVLVSDAFGGHGGIAKFNRDLLTALAANPAVKRLVALPRLLPEAAGALPEKLEFITAGVGGKFRYALAVLKSALGSRKTEIILCGHINLLPLAFLARQICKAPVVLVIHGIDAWQPPKSRLAARLAGKVDAVISVSEFTRRRFLGWSGLNSARSHILPNCVDLRRFQPGPKSAALLERYGLQGRTVLLTVARLSAQEHYKGVDEVLEVLPALAQEIPDISYLIIGDGSDRARLEKKAAALGVKDRVVFPGWIAADVLPENYRLADVFVMPGRGEGFGIVYLEALACGVPVVASKADASAEVAGDCPLAVTVNPDDREEIKAGILRALRLPRGTVTERVKEFGRDNFDQRCGEIIRTLVRARPTPSKVLVFRIGQLGDTIVALPAMWAVRKSFPAAQLTLLCDRHPGKSHVLAADLLRDAGLFDGFESYMVDDSFAGRALRTPRMFGLLLRLRRRGFDTMVYLAPSSRTRNQVERDRRFFAAAGIKKFIGMDGFPDLPVKAPGRPLAATGAEADNLLARLEIDGLPVPAAGRGSLDLRIGAAEEAEVQAWVKTLPPDGEKVWVGVGPGSKMPAKRWPEARFERVVTRLIDRLDVWPVVFGGAEDHAMGERLLRAWGRGFNAAGALSLRPAAAALQRCRLYLGNDTGTMHLAAAVGTPCVAIFSAREWPGMWYPYGVANRVFRSPIECEGCGLMECVEKKNECLKQIEVDEVLSACGELLEPAQAPHDTLPVLQT